MCAAKFIDFFYGLLSKFFAWLLFCLKTSVESLFCNREISHVTKRNDFFFEKICGTFTLFFDYGQQKERYETVHFGDRFSALYGQDLQNGNAERYYPHIEYVK
jgi:hypothetical protein